MGFALCGNEPNPPQWTIDKAREWLVRFGAGSCGRIEVDSGTKASLASLLVEVANNNPVRDDDHIVMSTRRAVLAEVRRVVEEENFLAVAACPVCSAKLGTDAKPIWRASILARLEKL